MTTRLSFSLYNCKLEKLTDHNILSGYVDGIELFFKTDKQHDLVLSADPFIAAMLLPAMQAGRDITIPDYLSASPKFLLNLIKLQEIFSLWYPELKPITIHCKAGAVDAARSNQECAAFFSGGLDASFTLLKNRDMLTHLIYVRGIDMQLGDDTLYKQCLDANREIADSFAKALVPIESNVRFFIRSLSKTKINWSKAQGCGLASIAYALGHQTVFISSSNTYDNLHPYGTHPLTDPLFSTESVTILHDGSEVRRHEKLLAVSKNDFLLQRIRVCWQDKGLNCGKCDKCLHFRIALTLCGLKTSNFAPLTNYAELAGAHVGTVGEFLEWDDNLQLARKVNNPKACRAINKQLNRFRLKQIAKLVDEVFFRGRFFKPAPQVAGGK
ncbi:MAG: hypothetical protein V4628_16020 [Pseudomonadota bacterium]